MRPSHGGRTRFSGELAMTLAFLAAAALFVGRSLHYTPQTRLMPLIVGLPTLALALRQLAADLRGGAPEGGGAGLTGLGAQGVSPTEGGAGDPWIEVKRGGVFLGSLAGYLLVIVAVGFLPATVLFLLFYLGALARMTWWQTGLVAGLATLLVWVLFVKVSGVVLPAGLWF